MPSDFISVTLRDGAVVRAQVMGQGPPLILYGNMVSWEFWAYQVPFFARHYRVIAPEYRSQAFANTSACDALADDVPDLVRTLGYEHALLMGHSIGAMVLARVLERTPEVVTAAVLANGFPYFQLVPRIPRQLQPKLVPLLWLYPRLPWVVRQLASFGLLWGTQRIFLYREPSSEKRKMFFSYTFTPDVSMVLRVATALQYCRLPDLRRATMPVLVVTGGADRWLPIHQAKELVQALPCGHHLVFPQAGHMTPMVVPEQFNRAVLNFLVRAENGML